MARQSIIARDFSSGHDDRLIRALIENQKSKGFNVSTFSETEVERVMEVGADRSALVLRSGVEILVALSYEQLEQRIYRPDFRNDGQMLDLRDVTGEAAQPKASNVNDAPAEPRIGDKISDGTVFAGISPDTNKPMYAAPAVTPPTMTFNEAQNHAAGLDTHGHQDWRVPTKAELNVLFNNRAAIGGFDISASNPAGWYWSSSQYNGYYAWGQRFSDGAQSNINKLGHLSVRPVR